MDYARHLASIHYYLWLSQFPRNLIRGIHNPVYDQHRLFFRYYFKTQQEKNSEISKTQGKFFKTQPKNLGVAWFLSIFINKVCPKFENLGQNPQKIRQNSPKFSQNSIFRQLDLRSSPNKCRKKSLSMCVCVISQSSYFFATKCC